MKHQKTAPLLRMPRLGQGTWYMAEDPKKHDQELRSLKAGIELGMNLIDTAEMYADGKTEILVGDAIHSHRKDIILVSKFYPQHADRRQLMVALENSLERLKTDYIDLYLYHWRGNVPLAETVATLNELVKSGKIRHWGVSNFGLDDMKELVNVPGGNAVATNQVLYNLSQRGIEWDLLPWCREHKIPIMAYSPLDHGEINHPVLETMAKRHGGTPIQIALAWVLHQPQVTAIPKSSSPAHVLANHEALDIKLTPEDLQELDKAFPPPDHAQPLEMY